MKKMTGMASASEQGGRNEQAKNETRGPNNNVGMI